jgi:pimeloyl-ACP methyl ester carboxylesterase
VFDAPVDDSKPTVVFIHGCNGSPSQFDALAGAAVGERETNLGALLYDDHERLATSAEVLRRDLRKLSAATTIITHSMGALLVGYVGATEAGPVCRMSAVHLNPLIGGSHYADDIPALRWLSPLKPFIQRVFFRGSVQDLAPESDFEQTIFGEDAQPSCLAAHSTALFSEAEGYEPDIVAERIPRFFGRTRVRLLEAFAQEVITAPMVKGHNAPLDHPRAVVPVLMATIERNHSADQQLAASP